jgi:hypothetical protein
MVYLAGDNNLQDYGVKDLREMKKAGSTNEVAVVAEFDAMSDHFTRRYYLTQSRLLSDDLLETLPETNTGDPRHLYDFVCWAVKNFPARHYALILWNHGSGWKEDTIYQAAERLGTISQLTQNVTRSLAVKRTSRSLFRTSLEWFIEDPQRAIAYDDSSADFLDNAELKHVLDQIYELIGKPVDLLGFDACLMSMIEIAYQHRDQAHFIVGSQELEPGEGWPYHTILSHLVEEPATSPRDLAVITVDAYAKFFIQHFPNLEVTQSAIQTEPLNAAVLLIDRLARTILQVPGRSNRQSLLFQVLRKAQKFKDPDYIDLLDLSRILATPSERIEVKRAANDLFQYLQDDCSPILASMAIGESLEKASGLSIYLPSRTLSPLYQNLDFARHTAWSELLSSLHEK